MITVRTELVLLKDTKELESLVCVEVCVSGLWGGGGGLSCCGEGSSWPALVEDLQWAACSRSEVVQVICNKGWLLLPGIQMSLRAPKNHRSHTTIFSTEPFVPLHLFYRHRSTSISSEHPLLLLQFTLITCRHFKHTLHSLYKININLPSTYHSLLSPLNCSSQSFCNL